MKISLIKQINLALMASGLLLCCSCGGQLNSLADEAAQKFNANAQTIKTAEDAHECLEYYKMMEMNFIKFKVKHGFEEPLMRYYAQTSNTLSRIEKALKLQPDYGSFERLMKNIAE